MSAVTSSKPAQAFMKLLKGNGGNWMSRSDIRDALHAPQFSSYWIDALEALVSEGLVERREDTRGTFQTVYVYRISAAQDELAI